MEFTMINGELVEMSAADLEQHMAQQAIDTAFVETGFSEQYRLYKSVFIARLTEGEAGVLEMVLAAADAKLRLMFNSVEYFISDDPLFVTLHGTVAGALGEARADELLTAG